MRYYGQHNNPQVDEYLHTEFFKETKNGLAIECGAYDGLFISSCKFFEEFLDWDIINIEADPELYKKLIKNRSSCSNFNLALTNKEQSGKTLEFKRVMSKKDDQILGLGGLYEDTDTQLTKIKRNFNVSSVSVKTTSYVDFSNQKISRDVDLFVLDVEGHEMSVLDGMHGSSYLPKVMCIEYPIVGLDKLTNKMEDLGYSFYSTVHNNAHYTLKSKK